MFKKLSTFLLASFVLLFSSTLGFSADDLFSQFYQHGEVNFLPNSSKATNGQDGFGMMFDKRGQVYSFYQYGSDRLVYHDIKNDGTNYYQDLLVRKINCDLYTDGIERFGVKFTDCGYNRGDWFFLTQPYKGNISAPDNSRNIVNPYGSNIPKFNSSLRNYLDGRTVYYWNKLKNSHSYLKNYSQMLFSTNNIMEKTLILPYLDLNGNWQYSNFSLNKYSIGNFILPQYLDSPTLDLSLPFFGLNLTDFSDGKLHLFGFYVAGRYYDGVVFLPPNNNEKPDFFSFIDIKKKTLYVYDNISFSPGGKRDLINIKGGGGFEDMLKTESVKKYSIEECVYEKDNKNGCSPVHGLHQGANNPLGYKIIGFLNSVNDLDLSGVEGGNSSANPNNPNLQTPDTSVADLHKKSTCEKTQLGLTEFWSYFSGFVDLKKNPLYKSKTENVDINHRLYKYKYYFTTLTTTGRQEEILPDDLAYTSIEGAKQKYNLDVANSIVDIVLMHGKKAIDCSNLSSDEEEVINNNFNQYNPHSGETGNPIENVVGPKLKETEYDIKGFFSKFNGPYEEGKQVFGFKNKLQCKENGLGFYWDFFLYLFIILISFSIYKISKW